MIFNPVVTSFNAGSFDIGAPGIDLSTLSDDPIISDSVLIYATFTKGPIVGFTSGDLTLTNCTVSAFTEYSQNIYTFLLNPIIDGPFTCQVAAATCTWNGISNLISNLLSKTYDSGSSYDLENAADISLLQHFRGHVASLTDCNDLLSYLSVPGMEMLYSKYNIGATMFANGDNPSNRDLFNFGRVDFGVITVTTGGYAAVNALVTAVRGGNPPSVGSYKNGDDSYSADMIARVLYMRNSKFEEFNQSLPTEYTGLDDVELSSRGVTFRNDYYAKTTGTNYYQGTQLDGDDLIDDYIALVISTNGWYSNFTHWHWQVADYPEHYLERLISAIGANDVFRGTVNQVAEYYFAKESVTSVTGLDNVITVNHTEDWPGSPYDKIKTPIWIRLDTTGTVLEGEDIACSNGLKVRKISANVFYVPVIMDFSGSSSTVSIGITTSPDYVNLTPPDISRTGNSVTVDQACKLTIYRVHKPTSLASSTTFTAIPTVDNTTVNMTVGTGLTIPVNMTVRVLNDSTHYFFATVTSYDSGTGALVLSCSSNVGTGTFASWTIDRYYHLLAAEIVERNFTYVTAYTILATLDNTNYDYYVAAINTDGISALE